MIPDAARLRYLIGTDGPYPDELERDNLMLEVSYDFDGQAPHPDRSIKYCNLFDEKYSEGRNYPPYAKPSDTAVEWGEGQIDPRGAGWAANLSDQFDKAIAQGFRYVELDNPDSYHVRDVLDAYRRAGRMGLRVIAKNPGCSDYDEDTLPLVRDRMVEGVIIEEGCGTPESMDRLRVRVGKPDLPIWFVGHGATQLDWCNQTAAAALGRPCMGVTHSQQKDYQDCYDILEPVPARGC